MSEPAPGDGPFTVDLAAPLEAAAPPSLDNLLLQAGNLGRSSLLALLRADQRKRWQRGDRMTVESYLGRLPALLGDEEGILDLIYSEVVLRGELSEAPDVEEYVRRFPYYEGPLRRQFALNEVLGSDSLLDLAAEGNSLPGSAEVMRTRILTDVPISAAPSKPVATPGAPLTHDATDGESLKVPAPHTIADLGGGVPAAAARPRTDWPSVKGYVILDVLGRGGMGVVYKARQITLKRTVALKMILSGAHASEQELERLRGEAEAVAKLQHPGIVQIYEVNEHKGLPYLALEYVDGGSLDRKLNGTPLPPREAAALVEGLAEAMDYAHQQGVIHRDLKPANVLLPSGERKSSPSMSLSSPSSLATSTPKITDFGLAKQLESGSHLTGSGAIVGTPSYMAPEQAAGKNYAVTPRTDVYALGAILYECLTGRPPFRASTPVDTILQVLSEEPVPPTQLNPKVPRDLQTICLKCLDKANARRFASAADLAADLRRWLNGEPITARPVGWTERVVKWVRRRPLVSGLLLVLFLVLGTGVTSVTILWLLAAAARDAESLALKNEREALANEKKEKDAKEAALEKSEDRLYLNRIALADREWLANNVPGVEQLLDHYSGDRRGWEWHYLKRLCHAERLSLPGQQCVAFSPDGKWLAAASQDRDIRLWDAASGRPGPTLSGHKGRVTRLAFSPDSKRLASAGADYHVRLWQIPSGEPVQTLKGHEEPIDQVAFSPDGKLLASASNNDTIKVWDAGTGKERLSLTGHTTVAFSPDGKLLAGAAGAEDAREDEIRDVVKLWNPQTGEEVRTLEGPHGHTSKINSVTFSPGGSTLATASDDQTVKLWDPATGEEKRTIYGRSGRVAHVVFSRDGRSLAGITGDVQRPGAVKLWDTATGQELRAYRWITQGGTDIAFHPDGQRLATADADTIKVWDAANDPESRVLRGKTDNVSHTNKVTGEAFSPDGRWLASGDEEGTVRVWDARTGKQQSVCLGHFKGVTAVAFSPDSKRLASSSLDRTVLFWDPATGDEVGHLRHPGPVLSLAFSPDGRFLVTGRAGAGETDPGEVVLWDVANGKPLRTLEARQVTRLAFSPDGSRIAGLSRFDILIWDAATGAEICTLAKKDAPFSSLVFSPDGKYLFAAGGVADHGQVTVWDARAGEEVRTMPGRGARATALAISPDGKRLALACWDHTVKLWDPYTGQDILTLRGHTGMVTCVAFCPDGTRLASGSVDQTVRLWDATPLPRKDEP